MRPAQRLRMLPGLSSAVVRRLTQRAPGVHPKSTLTRFKRLLARLNQPPPQRYATYMALMEESVVLRLMPDASACDHTSRIYESLIAGRDPVQAAMATDRVSYLPDGLLTNVDRCSMLHALEVRCPFMDHAVVHFASGLPTRLALGKRLLRQTFAGQLPDEILNRRKMGLAVGSLSPERGEGGGEGFEREARKT
jgi:asparagine synthetase B (glutamine-hydrolysing)